jgi:hypothetical protein
LVSTKKIPIGGGKYNTSPLRALQPGVGEGLLRMPARLFREVAYIDVHGARSPLRVRVVRCF